MLHTETRHRSWRPWLLTAVVAAGLCIATLERWRQEDVARVWSAFGLARVLNPMVNFSNAGLHVFKQIGRMHELETQNKDLRHKLTATSLLAQVSAEELRRQQRLSGLGHWSGPTDLRFVTADVTGLVTNEDSAEMIINRGSADGVRVRDPVVALEGLVGLVFSVAPHSAHVQGLADPLSAVGAVAAQTRVRGVVYGRGRGKALEFIPENEAQPVEAGMLLVTSGFENSIYPKGIVVGKITGRQANMYGMPFGAVQPQVPFDSIEEVLLIMPRRRAEGRTGFTTATLGKYEIQMPELPELTSMTLPVGVTSLIIHKTTSTLENIVSSTKTLNPLSHAKPTPSPTPNATPTPQPERKSSDDDADQQFGHHDGTSDHSDDAFPQGGN